MDYDYFYVFLIQCRLGETREARKELNTYIQSIPASKSNDWETSIAHFLAGDLDEQEFFSQATTRARRPTDISTQLCEAYYYIGMKHLLAGDKTTARENFQKCLDKKEDNESEYRSARAELNALKNP
jgi:lipoprotein NlpI